MAISQIKTQSITPGSTITGNLIGTGAINASNTIQAGSITGNLIGAGAISTNLFASSSITGNLIASNSIRSNNIVSEQITESTFVWHEGMSHWELSKDTPDVAKLFLLKPPKI